MPQRRGDPVVVSEDEGVRGDTTVESLGQLRPAFAKDGTITAGSASQISDGACAVVVMSKAKAEELGLTWLAEIGASRPGGRARLDPAVASRRARSGRPARRTASTSSDLDLVEINEAFAAVGIASARELGISEDIVNVNGGAIALGHPIGMSGARIVLHLALELQRRGGGVGAAALCGGGGQGDALIVRVPPRDAGRAEPSRAAADAARSVGGRRARSAAVAELVERAQAGEPRAVARLISLVEDASPLAARGRRAAGPAHRPRPDHRHHRLARRRQVDLDGGPGHGAARSRASGSACSPSTRRRRSPAARCSATGSGCRTTPPTPTSTSARWPRRGHLGGLAWATPQALRVLDAAGCDVVLIETVGVGQSEVEVAGTRRHDARAARARAWATASRRPRPGSSRSATCTSSTRPTGTAPTRWSATCARCSTSAPRTAPGGRRS